MSEPTRAPHDLDPGTELSKIAALAQVASFAAFYHDKKSPPLPFMTVFDMITDMAMEAAAAQEGLEREHGFGPIHGRKP